MLRWIEQVMWRIHMKKARGQLRAFNCSHAFDSIGKEHGPRVSIYMRGLTQESMGISLKVRRYVVSLCEQSEHVACVSDVLHIVLGPTILYRGSRKISFLGYSTSHQSRQHVSYSVFANWDSDITGPMSFTPRIEDSGFCACKKTLWVKIGA